jgi:hypothetical protein
MKALDENGNVILTPGGFPLSIPRNVESTKPYPVCGSVTKGSEFLCAQPAGAGTEHKGVGRCWKHGGRREKHAKHLLKLIGDTELIFPGIQNEFNRLAKDRDVFDMREHIFLMEAIMLTVLRHAKTVEDLFPVVKIIAEANKIIKSLDEIEHGRRLVIDVQGVHVIVTQIQEVIFRHISDPYTRDLIARDIRAVNTGGTSIESLPSHESSEAESGVAVEG